MTNLTKKAKIAIGSAGAGVLALAVALGIWQPWKAPAADDTNDTPDVGQQQEVKPPKEEEVPTLTVGGEEIRCVIFEGDGWSIYVPEEWVMDANENGGKFQSSEDGKQSTQVEVIQGADPIYAGDYVSAYPQYLSETETWQTRSFYHADTGTSWEVVCQAPEDIWDDYQRIMTAMARTMAVGDIKPFSGMSPVAAQPDWQITGDGTVLWMDKDGYIVNDAAEEYICTQMMAWPNEKKANYTGQYRMDDLTWAGSYTCVPGKEYIDVFCTQVWYELAPGKESEIQLADGMTIHEGWLYEGFRTHVIVYHDGSAVEKAKVIYTNDTSPGLPLYLSDLLQGDPDVVQELGGEELKAYTDWFNKVENNGLLRFPYETNTGVGDYLDVLFYDLGETEEPFTEEEKATLAQVGITNEICPIYKFSRAFVREYLQEKLGFGAEVDKFLEDAAAYMPGTYLKEYDAWYQCHGDTAYVPYTFDRGEFHPSLGGHVKLYYNAPYLTVADTNGFFDEPMVVTLRPTAEGEWVVLSNLQKIYAK